MIWQGCQRKIYFSKYKKNAQKKKQENTGRLKIFSGFRKTVITATDNYECINHARYEGNCTHIAEAQMIAAMAMLGGRRNSPIEELMVKTCQFHEEVEVNLVVTIFL